MGKAGRKYKLTPEVSARICEGIRLRMSQKHAAIRGGVSESVYYVWMREGEALERKQDAGEKVRPTQYQKACFQFLQDVRRATSDGQAALLAMVHKGARDDWRAAAWILERRHAESFSKRHYQALQDARDESITVVFHRPALDTETRSDDLTDTDDE
jgi:hypothetical protein